MTTRIKRRIKMIIIPRIIRRMEMKRDRRKAKVHIKDHRKAEDEVE
jgi:hypothetical protein